MPLNSQEFCRGELWNHNLTWFTDSPDFTACFHKTVLVYLPCAFLWLLSPFEVRSNLVKTKCLVPWAFFNVAKLLSCCLLAIISIVELVLFGILKKNEEVDFDAEAADFVGSGLKLATFLLAAFLILSGRRAGLLFSYLLCPCSKGLIAPLCLLLMLH